MKFIFKKTEANILDLFRNAGYSYRGVNNGLPATPGCSSGGRGDMSFIKRAGRDEYPHYHIYARDLGEEIALNLHLDQKKPWYESKGVHAHNGEYFGPVIDTEAERIMEVLEGYDPD